jgi:Glycosyl transferase family 21
LSVCGFPRLDIEYVLPLKWTATEDPRELSRYLRLLSNWLDVTVVDGSDPAVFERHRRLWTPWVRHLPPEPWPGRNGKVAGVVTGVRAARHEFVVIADDDVRWDRPGLEHAMALVADSDLVRPQNVFSPLPWHARWDTARSLVNRAFGADYPGTYALRRSTFEAAGGYDGDVLFENLEMARTLRAVGGREISAAWLYVRRTPPTTRHFLGQRTRQAYDDLAQPARLVAEMALLPVGLLTLRRVHSAMPGGEAIALIVAVLSSIGLGELGRRRHGGGVVYAPTAALWTPLWLAERACCVWLAVLHRLLGGMPYGGQRIRVAAHSNRQIQRRYASLSEGTSKRRSLR